MNNKLSKLLAFLKKENVSISTDKIHGLSVLDEALDIFSQLMPERICCYDTEVIDDIDGYHTVIQSHVQTTQGEWIVDDIMISGATDGIVKIEFSCNGKNVKWQFKQYGSDYVSEDFYKKLNNWVARNLSGKYISLPTYGQDIAFVYLPKKSANKLANFVENKISINMFVTHFITDEELPEAILNLKFDAPFDVSIRDSNGETALTAAIKAKNENKALILLDEFEVNPIINNLSGKSPLQLSRHLGLKNVAEQLEIQLTKKSEKWADTEKSFGTEKFGLFGPMIELISVIMETMEWDKMHHHVVCLPEITFSRTKLFELGENTLHVNSFFIVGDTKIPDTYTVKYYSGSSNDYVKENIALEDTLALINRYYE